MAGVNRLARVVASRRTATATALQECSAAFLAPRARRHGRCGGRRRRGASRAVEASADHRRAARPTPTKPAPLPLAADVSWPDCLQLVVLTSSKAEVLRRFPAAAGSVALAERVAAPRVDVYSPGRALKLRALAYAEDAHGQSLLCALDGPLWEPDAASPAGGVGYPVLPIALAGPSAAVTAAKDAFAAAVRASDEADAAVAKEAAAVAKEAAARAAAKAAGPAGALRDEQAAAVKAAAAPPAAAHLPRGGGRRRGGVCRRRAAADGGGDGGGGGGARGARGGDRRGGRGAAARGAEALWRRLKAAGVLVVSAAPTQLPRSVSLGDGGAEWSGELPDACCAEHATAA